VIIFINLNFGLAWSLIPQTIIQKPYILYGATVFLLLIPLGLTSFDIWKMRLGKNWKRLHQIIYIAAPIAVYHFALSKKGDIFHLQGDIVRPFVYGLVLLLLMILRLPFVRRFFASFRTRVYAWFVKPNPQPKMDTQQ
jgi:sulfoxide reductase heme-binding subunit YedZ